MSDIEERPYVHPSKRVARLWPGHKLPVDRPVYWMIWICDENDKPYHSRMSPEKCMTPQEAYDQAYGRGWLPEHAWFFNMTSRITECRTMVKEIAKLWHIEVAKHR